MSPAATASLTSTNISGSPGIHAGRSLHGATPCASRKDSGTHVSEYSESITVPICSSMEPMDRRVPGPVALKSPVVPLSARRTIHSVRSRWSMTWFA